MARLGIIGAGKMGEAILQGVLAKRLLGAGDILIADCHAPHLADLERSYGVRAAPDNRSLAAACDTVILAVKPRTVAEVLNDIAPVMKEGALLVSIAAGVPLNLIETRVSGAVGVIRAMPNLAVSVGEGMTVLSPGRNTSEAQVKTATEIFAATGKVAVLEEQHMDAVTGLSGSGPAYVFLIIESLAEGGVKLGLPREVATLLAAQTVLGAAKTVISTGEHPAKLKDNVTTPAGTTIEGLLELEEGGLRVTLIKAVVKAAERSRQLLHK